MVSALSTHRISRLVHVLLDSDDELVQLVMVSDSLFETSCAECRISDPELRLIAIPNSQQ